MNVETMTTGQITAELDRLQRDEWKTRGAYASGNVQVRIGELERELEERGRDLARAFRADTAPRPDSHPPVVMDARVAGHLAVINARLGTLQLAIRGRDWESVEFQYDRVTSAVGKLEELLGGER